MMFGWYSTIEPRKSKEGDGGDSPTAEPNGGGR